MKFLLRRIQLTIKTLHLYCCFCSRFVYATVHAASFLFTPKNCMHRQVVALLSGQKNKTSCVAFYTSYY